MRKKLDYITADGISLKDQCKVKERDLKYRDSLWGAKESVRSKWVCLGKIGFSEEFVRVQNWGAKFLVYVYWNYSIRKVFFKAQLIDRIERKEGWVDVTDRLAKILERVVDEMNKRSNPWLVEKEYLKWYGEAFLDACVPILQQVLMRWTL